MSKRLMRVLVALALVCLTAGAAVAGAQRTRNEFDASMSGARETPRGDPQGRGTFTVEFRRGQACYRMVVRGIAKPVAAHIHRGAAGVNGPVVIDLKPAFRGTSPRVSAKCVPAQARIVSAIRRNPARYDANVPTQQFPGGAARGQLRIHR